MYLFDIDGTLLLTGGAGTRAINRLFAERYGIKDALGGVSCAGKTDGMIFREISAKKLGETLPDEVIDELIETYVPMLAEEMVESAAFRLMPEVVNCLRFLRGERAVLGIATGNVEAAAMAKLDRAGLREYFSFGGFGCDSIDRSELVRAAVERGRRYLNRAASAEEFVVVGDTVRDVDAARACGVRVVAVATGSVSREELAAAEPDAVFDTLAELPAWHAREVA